MDSGNLVELIARVKAGDEDAIREFREYETMLRIMVRAHLPQKLRSQFDSMDFVQIVWQNVFRIVREDPGRLSNSGELCKYLAGMVRNKVFEEHRRLTRTRKYNLAREEPLYLRRGNRDVPHEVEATAASPLEEAQARDWLEVVAGEHPRALEVIKLRLSGLTHKEIALRTGLHERSIRRIIETLRRRLETRDSGGSDFIPE